MGTFAAFGNRPAVICKSITGPPFWGLAVNRQGQDSMSEQKSRVVSVGEVTVELARGSDGRFGLGSGGDTFTTAIYLARAGINVAYATALGDDPYSDAIRS